MNNTPDSSLAVPRRIQRKRVRGWRMPPGAVYVGRPTRWGNPWRVGSAEAPTAAVAVARYRARLLALPAHQRALLLAPLRGRDLCCWCRPGQPCHADVLLALANA